MRPARRHLLAYGAFAPYISFILAFILPKFVHLTHFEVYNLAFHACLIIIPVTFMWATYITNYYKKVNQAAIAVALLMIGHFTFYGHLTYIVEFGDVEKNSIFLTIMGTLISSGVALLLAWDNLDE